MAELQDGGGTVDLYCVVVRNKALLCEDTKLWGYICDQSVHYPLLFKIGIGNGEKSGWV